MFHVLSFRHNPKIRSVVLQNKASWGWERGQEQAMSPKWEKNLSWEFVWKSVLCELFTPTWSYMKTVTMSKLSDSNLVIKFQIPSCVAGTLIVTYICWDILIYWYMHFLFSVRNCDMILLIFQQMEILPIVMFHHTLNTSDIDEMYTDQGIVIKQVYSSNLTKQLLIFIACVLLKMRRYKSLYYTWK